MDADYLESQRDPILSRREKRWSMNSQRLEEIVAELMKPISDVRRSFDTDLCALLEEYLTEAGLHALEASEPGRGGEPGGGVGAPNFAELALLLQQSASIYGRKVDFLYQHVLDCSESLHTSTQEIANTSATEEAQTPSSSSRRKRKASVQCMFGDIELEACAGARREAGCARPPPTLPRMFLPLEPRALHAADAPLTDYAGDIIGLLADFHVTRRLHEGLLVDELEGGAAAASPALRPLSLVELQAALEAAAPPLPATPPCTPPPGSPRPDSPPPSSPRAPSPLCASTPLPRDPPPARRDRKRRSDVNIDDVIGGTVKILISKELRRKLSEAREYSIPGEWISRLVVTRKNHIVSERRRLRAHTHAPRPHDTEDEFRGFDASDAQDVGGFAGWSCGAAADAAEAALAARVGSSRAGEGGGGGGADSDDDGFFEQSSLGDSDASRVDDSPLRAVIDGGGVGGVAGGRGAARGGGGGARRRGRARAGRRRAARAAAAAARAHRLPGPAASRRRTPRRRVAPAARHALPGERGQRGGDPGRAAVGGLVLAATGVDGRAAVLRRRRRRRPVPAVSRARRARLARRACVDREVTLRSESGL